MSARSSGHRPAVAVEPLTAERFGDFEKLFGPRGACGGCWCMTPRLTRAQYEKQKGEGNRRAMRALVDGGRVPGLIAYVGGEPAGWISIEERARFPSLSRSRVLAPIDAAPVWSIVCLFIARPHRRRGLSRTLIDAAVRYAAGRGGGLVEAYPIDPIRKPMPDVFAWTGLLSAFLRCGFEEVARRSRTRPIVRKRARRPRA